MWKNKMCTQAIIQVPSITSLIICLANIFHVSIQFTVKTSLGHLHQDLGDPLMLPKHFVHGSI